MRTGRLFAIRGDHENIMLPFQAAIQRVNTVGIIPVVIGQQYLHIGYTMVRTFTMRFI